MRTFLWVAPLVTAGCTFLFGGVLPICGDGFLQGNEQCDDSNDRSGDGCDSNCGLENVVLGCGNGNLDEGEACDGANLGGESCQSQQFASGDLACLADCSGFDTSGCSTCGDNTIDAGEVCDGTNLGLQDCQSQGFAFGSLACLSDCSDFDTSGCTNCGNNTINNDEACDGTNLNNQSCETFGGVGQLACNADCTFNVADCCGDGLNDPSKLCYSPLQLVPSSIALSSLAADDINLDGRVDLITGDIDLPSSLHVFLQNLNGSFSEVLSGTGSKTDTVAPFFVGASASDLLVVRPFAGTVAHFTNIGNGSFVLGPEIDTDPTSATSAGPGSMVITHLNNDNIPDWVVINVTLRDLFFCLDDGASCSQSGSLEFSSNITPIALASGDFNDDGSFDIAVVTLDGLGQNIDLILLENQGGKSTLGASVSLESSASPPSKIAVADFDGNGIDEVAVTFPGISRIKLFEDGGAPKDLPLGLNAQHLVAADLNGDNIIDLAVTNPGAATLSIALGREDGSFNVQPTLGICVGPSEIIAAHINADAILDLAVLCGTQLGLLLSNP